jgi:RNA polymerase sigma factor (sigma-70 family)
MTHEEIHRKYHARLQATANKIVDDWHEADAIATDAIYAALKAFNPERGSIESLLFTAARNKAKIYVAKQNRKKRCGTVPLLTEPATVDDDPGQRELIERLTVALDGLSAEQRQVVQLRYFDSVPERAAAEQLAITRHRLRKLESAALDTLRKWPAPC